MAEELAKTEEREFSLPVSTDDGEYSMYLDKAKFEHIQRVASVFAASDLVPAHYKGKTANCMIAFNWATRLNIDPLMLMQKTHIIQGKPGMEAQLVIALVNARGPFKGPIQWTLTGEGKNRSCTAYAVHKATNERCKATITWEMVELEGWSKKAGSKWLTIPEQMFKYRSAVFLARLYCPEVILGFQTVDEIVDTGQDKPDNEPAVSSLEERLTPKKIESMVVEEEEKPVQEIEEPVPEVDEPKEIATPEPEPKTPSTVNPEERWFCKVCDEIFPEPKGAKTKKCPHCLSVNIVDRLERKVEPVK